MFILMMIIVLICIFGTFYISVKLNDLIEKYTNVSDIAILIAISLYLIEISIAIQILYNISCNLN